MCIIAIKTYVNNRKLLPSFCIESILEHRLIALSGFHLETWPYCVICPIGSCTRGCALSTFCSHIFIGNTGKLIPCQNWVRRARGCSIPQLPQWTSHQAHGKPHANWWQPHWSPKPWTELSPHCNSDHLQASQNTSKARNLLELNSQPVPVILPSFVILPNFICWAWLITESAELPYQCSKCMLEGPSVPKLLKVHGASLLLTFELHRQPLRKPCLYLHTFQTGHFPYLLFWRKAGGWKWGLFRCRNNREGKNGTLWERRWQWLSTQSSPRIFLFHCKMQPLFSGRQWAPDCRKSMKFFSKLKQQWPG